HRRQVRRRAARRRRIVRPSPASAKTPAVSEPAAPAALTAQPLLLSLLDGVLVAPSEPPSGATQRSLFTKSVWKPPVGGGSSQRSDVHICFTVESGEHSG